MAKKRAKQKEQLTRPTFEVRFKGPGISPEKVSLRAVSDALSAIQDLASGRDPYETQHVPTEKGIGLVDVRKGSAVYACVARNPSEAKANLNRVRGILSDTPSDEDEDALVAAFRPIESLSDVAKSLGCRLEVALPGQKKHGPLFTVGRDDFDRIAGRLFIEGETTVTGTVQRVGGATEMRCLMRLPSRRKILYCDLANKEVARRLGQHLYEEVAATGKVVWLHRSWRIHSFMITDFRQPKLGNVAESIEELRRLGLDKWDSIDDPREHVKELRG